MAPGALSVIELPWVSELKGGDQDACVQPPDPGVTRVIANGAYRLRTDKPVTVYQLSPLEYALASDATGCPRRADCPYPKPKDPDDPDDPANLIRAQFEQEGCLSFTNDASLLLPATALTRAYTTLAWPSQVNTAAFLSITATSDNTLVTLSGKGRFAPGAGIDATGTGSVALNRGDVLEVVSQHAAQAGEFDSAGDPSGTRIVASAPVSVIAGHSCANVPEATTLACDHLEESLLPSETLGTDYLVTYPAARASRSPLLIRIVPSQDDTRVSFPDGAPGEVAPASCAAGCVVNLADAPLELRNVDRDFRVTSDKPILVGMYMLGQAAVESGSGDPSLSVAVPSEQFRNDYIFIASKTYDVSFVNVVAKTNSKVLLDGELIPIAEFEPIGDSGYSVARHELTAAEVHHAQSSEPFGIVVYGYGTYTSYMYPGGLDLKRIAPAVVR